jgi:uncharacterized protein (TIGR03435 family)
LAPFSYFSFWQRALLRIAKRPQKADSGKASPSFEVAAIKSSRADDGSHSVNTTSDRISVENYTLGRLIVIAYGLKSDTQISGGPKWMNKQAFDISAKMDDAEVAKMRGLKREERQEERNLLLQALLVFRTFQRISE